MVRNIAIGGDDMARLGTAKSRLSTYLLVLALTTPGMVLGQSRQTQPPAQTEEERARELAVIDAEIARAEAEARAAEAEARAAEAEARAAEAEARAAETAEAAEDAIEQAGNLAEDAIEQAGNLADNVVRDPSLRTTFNARSWGRTGTGLGLIAAGVMFGLRQPCVPDAANYRHVDFGSVVPGTYLAADGVQVSGTDWVWGSCVNAMSTYNVVALYQGQEIERFPSLAATNERLTRLGYRIVDEHEFFPSPSPDNSDAAGTRFLIGLGMIGVGTLLATIWADVPSVDLSASIMPRGGVLVSHSYGW